MSCAAYVMNTNHTNWTNKMIRMIWIIRGLITYKIIRAITWALYVRLLLFVYFGVWCYFELEWRLCLIRYSAQEFRTRIARITRIRNRLILISRKSIRKYLFRKSLKNRKRRKSEISSFFIEPCSARQPWGTKVRSGWSTISMAR